MRNLKINLSKVSFLAVLAVLLIVVNVNADVLVLQINSGSGYEAGETAIVTGALQDDSFNGINGTSVEVYLDGTLKGTATTDSDGKFEYSIADLTAGEHNLTANTSAAEQTMTFTVYAAAQLPSYKIIASSLVTRLSNPNINVTVQKYLGDTLTNESVSYSVYYDNGTQYGSTSSLISAAATLINLPSEIGSYTVVFDNTKTLTASVAMFSLKQKITDEGGQQKTIFKPSGIVYFEVEGFSNGQKIENATVTATVIDPSNNRKTVTFTETNGLYTGNTNVTTTTPLQLQGGEYEVVFSMEDSSNNEQTVKGYFEVLGLSVAVDLIDKVPYKQGELAEFDIVVKNLANGNLVSHDDITYTFEIVQNGKTFDTSTISAGTSEDPTISSELNLTIPTFSDGNYFLKVKATSNGKKGSGLEFFEVMNTEVYVDLTDNFDGFREIFVPEERAKVSIYSNINQTAVNLSITNKNGIVVKSSSKALSSTDGFISFSVPSTQGDYKLDLSVLMENGQTVKRVRWFRVQNYFSFMDVKDLNENFQFVYTSDENFLGEIRVFDITTWESIDISNFRVKFDKIVSEEDDTEYTNIQATKNASLSDESTGYVTYNINPPALPNGFYRMEYTLIDDQGNSLEGMGWFGISEFNVGVQTYDASGNEKIKFSAGETINVTVTLSSSHNGTATIYRDFFDELSFNIVNGVGSTELTSAAGNLPSQDGFYGFGVEVITDANSTGLGDGFFEIKSLNFRSIAVRNNGEFSANENILADIVVEKSGDAVSGANVSLARIVRASDWFTVSGVTYSAALTSSTGATTLNITTGGLDPGDYFVELLATKDNSRTYEGFGFRIVEDKIEISLSDTDKIFSSSDMIEITVKVYDQNDNPKDGVEVNLTGLLNFATWASVAAQKSTTTQNGSATIEISASNFNSGWYAPIFEVEGITGEIVGFGDSEFEIKPFTATVDFQNQKVSYNLNESIVVDVTATGTLTIESTVTDSWGVEYALNSFYANDQITLINTLPAGQYFLELSITQSNNIIYDTLWFEVIAPHMHIDHLMDPVYLDNETINMDYTVFTFGADGWNLANATVVFENFENLWSGDIQNISGVSEDVNETGTISFDLTSHSLGKGDYLLNMYLEENPNEVFGQYFRVEKEITIDITPTQSGRNVTFATSLSGFSSPQVRVVDYVNYDEFIFTDVDQILSGSEFNLTNLSNGFYEVHFEITDGPEFYWENVFFEVREKDISIGFNLGETHYVGQNLTFNINSTITSTFWLINLETQNVVAKEAIPVATDYQINITPQRTGFYMYSFGNDKFDSYRNGVYFDVMNVDFNVEWPFENNRFVLNGADAGKTFSFNVSSGLENAPLSITFKNFFDNTKTTVSLGNTNATANQKNQYNFVVDTDLGLGFGPHDVQIELDDGSDEPPVNFFFIDIFPDAYDVWTWNEQWEYKPGEDARVHIEVYDIANSWSKVNPTAVNLLSLKDPFGSDVAGVLALSQDVASFSITDSMISGNYHGEYNVTLPDATKRTFPLDFYVRGHDNLEVFWQQNKWDYESSEIFEFIIDVRDKGVSVENVSASLLQFESWPEDFDSDPTPVNIAGAYNFSNSNKTNSEGRVTFNLSLSGLNGGYSGRLNVGGQVVWFDFKVQNYQVESQPTEWEYGLTDTIEVNVRARDFSTWNLLDEAGNVTIAEVTMFDPTNWQPNQLNLSAFSITDPIFEVSGGEALLEMFVNTSNLTLSAPAEFEIRLDMDLEASGQSEGRAWFRVSNTAKPSASIVDANTGEAVSEFFGGQTYQLQVSNVNSAKIRNMWGPGVFQFDEINLDNSSGTHLANFTTPDVPGWYTLEIEIDRGAGYYEHIYEDFNIGGTLEMFVHSDTPSVIPGVNFTIFVELFGEAEEDPWCAADPYCVQDWVWFGPLVNKTVTLAGFTDVESGAYTDLSVDEVTNEFPIEWFAPQLCMAVQNESECSAVGVCMWVSDHCEADMMGMDGDDGPDGDDQGGDRRLTDPGIAVFNINPADSGMVSGGKYSLVFEYIDNSNVTTEENYFIQVEKFHTAISKRTQNVAAKSNQSVWVKVTRLNGTSIENCEVNIEGIYNEKDFQLAKSLNIVRNTSSVGVVEFSFISPSLPGEYLVEGDVTCEIESENEKQDISYFLEVGAKDLEVDMKSKFQDAEVVKVLIKTTDRLRNPVSQRLDVNLFHDRDDYPLPVYSLGGVDCVALDAAQDWFFGGGDTSGGSVANNRLEITTDANGLYELEICPLPTGEYSLEIFPLFEFANFGDDKDDDGEFGFRQEFVVSSAEIEITSDLIYEVGDSVTLLIKAEDEDGNPINGSLVYFDALTLFGEEELLLMEDSTTVALNESGEVEVTYVIPAEAPAEFGNDSMNYTVTPGPIDVGVIIEDSDGNKHSKAGMQYAIVRNASTMITAPVEVKTNSMIPVTVTTDSLDDYMIREGVFFLQENADKEKTWLIKGGVLFENQGDGTSKAAFSVLSPKEPGSYYLGMPIKALGSLTEDLDSAVDLIIVPIDVTLDLINVTGKIVNLSSNPIADALIKVGKEETETLGDGTYEITVPKGKYSVKVETNGLFMKTEPMVFNENREVNMTVYPISVNGSLAKTTFNITRSTNLETETKLGFTGLIANLGAENLTGVQAQAIATSGKALREFNLSNSEVYNVTFTQLYAGFEESDKSLVIVTRTNSSGWNSSAYISADKGEEVNATVGYEYKIDYKVYTYAKAGDMIDNDNDGAIDEEIDNNKDDDGDGKIDEDLEADEIIEGGYCGDGICQFDESCVEDCGGNVAVCGDGVCDYGLGEDTFCFDDCFSAGDTCTPNVCEDMAFSQGEWCNAWGIKTTEDYCDYCSWADPAFCGESCNEFNCWACDTAGDSASECANAGCSLGTDGQNSWCYWEEPPCSDNDCYACHNETSCSGTSVCEWFIDPWSPDGGYCERPFSCEYDCKACTSEAACGSTTANFTEGSETVGCVWEPTHNFCDFNFSHGGYNDRAVKNFWLAENNTAEAWEAVADFEGLSGNHGMDGAEAGCYFVRIELASTDVNVSVNGTLVGSFTGAAIVDTYTISSCFTFTDGEWSIEVTDLLGPDDFTWNVRIGNASHDDDDPAINITGISSAYDSGLVNLTFVLDDLADLPACGASLYDDEKYTYLVDVDSKVGGISGNASYLEGTDYRLFLDVNSTNETALIYSYDGAGNYQSQMALGYDIACGKSEVSLMTSRINIGANECDNITLRYLGALSDFIMGSWVIADVYDKPIVNLTLSNGTCGAPPEVQSSNVTLSGMRVYANNTIVPDGEMLEVCFEKDDKEDCFNTTSSNYLVEIPADIYNISFYLGGSGWNNLELEDFNLANDTGLNLTVYEYSDLYLELLSSENLTLDTASQVIVLNLSIGGASSTTLVDYSAFVEVMQGDDGEEVETHFENLSLAPGFFEVVQAEPFTISSATYAPGEAIAMLIIENETTLYTDEGIPIAAINSHEIGVAVNITGDSGVLSGNITIFSGDDVDFDMVPFNITNDGSGWANGTADIAFYNSSNVDFHLEGMGGLFNDSAQTQLYQSWGDPIIIGEDYFFNTTEGMPMKIIILDFNKTDERLEFSYLEVI